MKRLAFLYILMLLLQASVHSQDRNYICDSLINVENSDGILKANLYVNPFPGSNQQFFNDWTRGDVYLNDNKVAGNQLLRYNSYTDEIIWLRESDYKTGIIIKETVKKVVFNPGNKTGEMTFSNKNIRLPMQINAENVYLQVLEVGEMSLYCYRKIKYVKNSTQLFYINYQYFLFSNGEYIPISLKKKVILRYFSENDRARFKSIIRTNKLRIRKEPDLIKALTLYNESSVTN